MAVADKTVITPIAISYSVKLNQMVKVLVLSKWAGLSVL